MSTPATTPFIDFSAIKKRVPIYDVLRLLDIVPTALNKEKQEYRMPCSACATGSDRALVVSETDQKFWCHAKDISPKPSGDVIALVAHLRKISMYQSAKFLDDAFPAESDSRSKETKPSGNRGFDPEDFAAKLDKSDEALAQFGLAPSVRDEISWIGVIQKGHHKRKLAIPFRGEFGEFCFFAFSHEALYVPKKWRV